MKVVYLLSYPIYHDFWSKEEWLKLINQNRWIPGIISDMGHDTEFWVVDKTASAHKSSLDGFGDYTIRMFTPDSEEGRTKFHTSSHMVSYAEKYPPDLVFVKGVDGGIGNHFIKNLLLPKQIPYVMVTGGQYYHPQNTTAEFILYESEYQKKFLEHPAFFFWRKAIDASKLIRMQKSVDLEVFKPYKKINKEYDAISVGRIVKRNKRFDEIGELSKYANVAVLGDGPYKATLENKYPDIKWLDRVPNSEVSKVINRAKTYIHPSAKDWVITRDFYPRAIAEALACGLPCIGFDDAIQADIIPETCGILINRSDTVNAVKQLFDDTERLHSMAQASRSYAEAHLGKFSTQPVLQKVFEQLEITS